MKACTGAVWFGQFEPVIPEGGTEMLRSLLSIGGCMVAGGAIVRMLIDAPRSDIDIFVFGAEGRETFERVIGRLVACGATTVARDEREPKGYLHMRAVLAYADQTWDIIWSEKWTRADDVLDGFDLTCCQVGLRHDGDKLCLVATYEGALSIMRRQFMVTKNVWPTTPARVEKYQGLGFTLVGDIPSPAITLNGAAMLSPNMDT